MCLRSNNESGRTASQLKLTKTVLRGRKVVSRSVGSVILNYKRKPSRNHKNALSSKTTLNP